MKIAKKLIITTIIILSCISNEAFAQEKDPIKILFVGNSFTYFWNTPELVEAIGQELDTPINARQSTVGGSNLEQHWKEERNTNTIKLLEQEKWDYVILQDHSLSTIDAKNRFKEYTQKFIRLIKDKGATPILLMTWAYDSNPLMQEQITKEYLEIGSKNNIMVIPAGSLWKKTRSLRPDLELFFDNIHPSLNGSYLNALLIFKSLTDKSITEVPDRLHTIHDGEKLYLALIRPTNAIFLKQLVEESDLEKFK